METRLREPNNDRRGRVFSRRLQDPLLAAFVTAVIYWTVMLLGKYVPFGINTPAVTDAKLQYLDLFAYYRDVLTGQNSAVCIYFFEHAGGRRGSDLGLLSGLALQPACAAVSKGSDELLS